LDIGDPAPRFLSPAPDGLTSDQLAKHVTLHARALRWRQTIDLVHQSAGWGSDTPYKGNGRGREWCGFFAAHCWRAAGIDPKWLAPFYASTLRLYNWAHYRPWNQHQNPAPAKGDPRRLVLKLDTASRAKELAWEPRPGDIVVIGSNPEHPEGRHICIATGFDADRSIISTVEGNGYGTGPDGHKREGIVVGERKIGGGPGDVVLWVYRPAVTDLLSA
jgi:hypothetical protein